MHGRLFPLRLSSRLGGLLPGFRVSVRLGRDVGLTRMPSRARGDRRLGRVGSERSVLRGPAGAARDSESQVEASTPDAGEGLREQVLDR